MPYFSKNVLSHRPHQSVVYRRKQSVCQQQKSDYRLCNSKTLNSILLYYEPIGSRVNANFLCKKIVENVMRVGVCRQKSSKYNKHYGINSIKSYNNISINIKRSQGQSHELLYAPTKINYCSQNSIILFKKIIIENLKIRKSDHFIEICKKNSNFWRSRK